MSIDCEQTRRHQEMRQIVVDLARSDSDAAKRYEGAEDLTSYDPVGGDILVGGARFKLGPEGEDFEDRIVVRIRCSSGVNDGIGLQIYSTVRGFVPNGIAIDQETSVARWDNRITDPVELGVLKNGRYAMYRLRMYSRSRDVLDVVRRDSGTKRSTFGLV